MDLFHVFPPFLPPSSHSFQVNSFKRPRLNSCMVLDYIIHSKPGRSWQAGSPQNVLAICVEPHTPQPHPLHQGLGLLQPPVASENGLDKFTSAVGTHLQRAFCGGGAIATALDSRCTPHVFFAGFKQPFQPAPETVARLEEILHHFIAVWIAHARQALVCTFHLPSKLNEQQPKVATDFADGCRRPVMVDGPIIDPFTQTVGVEDGSQEEDGRFGRVPIFRRVPCRDPGASGVSGSGLTMRGARFLGFDRFGRALATFSRGPRGRLLRRGVRRTTCA